VAAVALTLESQELKGLVELVVEVLPLQRLVELEQLTQVLVVELVERVMVETVALELLFLNTHQL
jgi:hypothetical protein